MELLLSRMHLARLDQDGRQMAPDQPVAHLVMRIDGAEVPSRRLATGHASLGARGEAGRQASACLHAREGWLGSCASGCWSSRQAVAAAESRMTLSLNASGLERGMHVVEASLLVRSGRPAIGHMVSFWLASPPPPPPADAPDAGGKIGRPVGAAPQASEKAAAGAWSPSVHVVGYKVREAGGEPGQMLHDMAVWVVVDNLEVGREGGLLVSDNNAKAAMAFPRLLEWGPETSEGFIRRLWPIAEVACKAGRCTVTRALCRNPIVACEEGLAMPWRGGDVGHRLVLYELALPMAPEREQVCLRRPYTVSLVAQRGMGIEESLALSQWHVDLYCTPGQLPAGASLQAQGAELRADVLANRRWQQAPWLHRHPHLARLSSGGTPTCHWYTGPLAGAPPSAPPPLAASVSRLAPCTPAAPFEAAKASGTRSAWLVRRALLYRHRRLRSQPLPLRARKPPPPLAQRGLPPEVLLSCRQASTGACLSPEGLRRGGAEARGALPASACGALP